MIVFLLFIIVACLVTGLICYSTGHTKGYHKAFRNNEIERENYAKEVERLNSLIIKQHTDIDFYKRLQTPGDTNELPTNLSQYDATDRQDRRVHPRYPYCS